VEIAFSKSLSAFIYLELLAGGCLGLKRKNFQSLRDIRRACTILPAVEKHSVWLCWLLFTIIQAFGTILFPLDLIVLKHLMNGVNNDKSLFLIKYKGELLPDLPVG